MYNFLLNFLIGIWKPSLWILDSKFQVVLEFWSIKLSSFHFLILKWTFFILLILKACNSTAVKNSAAKTNWATLYITAINWWKNGGLSSTFRCFFYPSENSHIIKEIAKMASFFARHCIYNRLPLIKCPLLDIDLAIYGLFLLYEEKFYKSWSCYNLMEIWF